MVELVSGSVKLALMQVAFRKLVESDSASVLDYSHVRCRDPKPSRSRQLLPNLVRAEIGHASPQD